MQNLITVGEMVCVYLGVCPKIWTPLAQPLKVTPGRNPVQHTIYDFILVLMVLSYAVSETCAPIVL